MEMTFQIQNGPKGPTLFMGRPMKEASIREELVMEIQSAAMEGFEAAEVVKLRALFERIVKASYFVQAVNRGLRTQKHEINGALLAFLNGEENLN